jgi:hypothetical protein
MTRLFQIAAALVIGYYVVHCGTSLLDFISSALIIS